MTTQKWHEGRLVGYDVESTGIDPHTARIDPHTARIVTAAVVHTSPGLRPSTIQWLIDPGVEVPDEAAAVHGWTRARILEEIARAHPKYGRGFTSRDAEGLAIRVTMSQQELGAPNQMIMAADGALGEIAGHVGIAMHTDTPLVIANAPYDLTLTEVELTRHGIDTLASRPAGIRGVVDPMVLEKQWDPYRKVNREGGCRGGKFACGGCGATNKQLSSLCQHYGLRLTSAHSAGADALAAVRLVVKLAQLWPDIARLKRGTLHQHQVGWRRDQMTSLRAYFDRNQIEHDGCDPAWPLLQAPAVA